MLQDAIWANTDKLNSDAEYKDTATKFVKASMKGWVYCRDNPQDCVDIVLAKGSKLGASHQLWQMNEINKLIWPSANGVGIIDDKAWAQTVDVALNTKNAEGTTVITKQPDKDAYTNDDRGRGPGAAEGRGHDRLGLQAPDGDPQRGRGLTEAAAHDKRGGAAQVEVTGRRRGARMIEQDHPGGAQEERPAEADPGRGRFRRPCPP